MTTVENIRVNGRTLSGGLSEQITGGGLVLSTRSVPRFSFTAMDTDDMALTRNVADLLDESATITWEDYAFRINAYTTGGSGEFQTVAVEATSDLVRALQEETGGESWGKSDVSAWARARLREKAATVRVQPDLGVREITREEPQGDHVEPQSTLDVISEMAKQVGAWFYHNGEQAVLGRPSWLMTQTGVNKYRIRWDSWTSHTEGLTSPPRYRWDRQAKVYEGRESLTITAVDPGTGGVNTLAQCRPGDVLHYEGLGVPSDDPEWLVTEVRHPLTVTEEVTIIAWRAVDPPEMVDEGADSGGESTAGVPDGPLGSMGWRGKQLENAAEIVREGQRRKLPDLALELAVATAMGESSLRNKGYGDAAGPDSCGLFQQRDTWGSRSDRLSPGKAAGFYYDALTGQPYQTNYAEGAYSLEASNIGAVYIGPGKTADAASVTIHRVQVNADPYHYARFWTDARLVVRECLAAGEAAGEGTAGGKATGPLGQRIDEIMARLDGQWIDVDGAYGAQCVDLAAKFITDLTGIPMVQANGKDYFAHPGLTSKFQAVTGFRSPRKGDVVAWAGDYGAYPNGGYGHVAVYSHHQGGTPYFLTQNPGRARVVPLQTAGIMGVMRPKG